MRRRADARMIAAWFRSGKRAGEPLMKDAMVEALGEQRLLLPELISGALAANERVKYLLTLLQTARSAADGVAGLGDLGEERLASGVQDSALDRVVGAS